MNRRTQLDFFHDPAPNVQQLVDRGALFVLNHSGGKDSQLSFIRVREQVPARQMVCIHAPLGHIEWPGALELARDQAAAAGVPFLLAAHGAGKTLLDNVRNRRRQRPEVPSWPSAKHRQCTSDLKTGPCTREARRFADANGFGIVINCLGLRASESLDRYKQLPWALNEKRTTRARTWYDWLPIHNLFTAEVFAGIKAAGQVPHYAYALGNERLSCIFCIMASAGDLRVGAIANPEVYAEYVGLEQETGYTMHVSRKSLPELTGLSIDQAFRLHVLNRPEMVLAGAPEVLFSDRPTYRCAA
jgi:3'-phosphoadenosine 5'-phosphosulfate sulfotransferase (PAPS reductase)/FAD synthetase